MSSLYARYNPLVSVPFDIERVGKKGDTNTTYETYPLQQDNARIEDFPEVEIENVAFQVKTAEEMNYYLDTGSFPENNTNTRQNTTPQRRPVRETPAPPFPSPFSPTSPLGQQE